jgi:hypothetical protein
MDFLSESVSTEDFQTDHEQYFNKWSGRISSVKFPMMAGVITKLLTKAKLSVLRMQLELNLPCIMLTTLLIPTIESRCYVRLDILRQFKTD